MNYAQPKGIRWNALRMFNVYGPGQDITKPDQGVVGIFMNMLLQRDDVQVKGRLDRFRDLIHIDDVVQGWDRCLHGGAYNQAFNLGTGDKTTFEGLIRSHRRRHGQGGQGAHRRTARHAGRHAWVASPTSRASARTLGYAPAVSADAQVSKTCGGG